MFFNINEREYQQAMHLIHCLNETLKHLIKVMPALDTLNANLADQTTAINEIATAIKNIPPNGGSGGATEQQVADAAASVAANNVALRAQVDLIPKPAV